MKCCVIGCDNEAKFAIYNDTEMYMETYVCGDHLEEYTCEGDRVYPFNAGGE